MAKKTEEIVKVANTAIAARPDFIPAASGAIKGMENMHGEDFLMPRLQIAQKMSAQIDADSMDYIEGLEFGQFYNNLTKENYGNGPLTIIPLWTFKSRIKFIDGGGKQIECSSPNAIDGGRIANTCAVCPYSQFADNQTPKCKLLYNAVVLMENKELIAVSMKGASVKTARKFNSFIRQRGANAAYAGTYTLSGVKTQNEKGIFYVFDINNKGWVDEPTFKLADSFYTNLREHEAKIAATIHNSERPEEGDVKEDTPF